jgi:uncharacterized lipoprotein YddW (UPF0748 family)
MLLSKKKYKFSKNKLAKIFNPNFCMQKLVFLIFLSFTYYSISAQTNQSTSTQELRGVWLGTAFNNDWPDKAGQSTEEQKKQLVQYFNLFNKIGINTVYFQVRPMGDAIYPSKTESWSRYLTGTYGQAPSPYYDPLAYTIQLAKEHNIELHAWFNPFRALIQNKWDNNDYFFTKYQVYKDHPDWFVDYGNRKYFNPGIPEARQYIISVIMEVVRKYKVAGVHFDDYYYPYPQSNIPPFDDIKTFYKYHKPDQNIKDWRRYNVNEFMRELHDSLTAFDPHLQLGVAPPAVWRNAGFDARGSNTRGLSAYDDLYADTRKWLAEGWIDYIVPQMYAEVGNSHADFAELARWWNENHFNRQVYAGIALYRLDAQSQYHSWQSVDQIKKQMNIVRKTPTFQGEVFFSAKNLLNNTLAINDVLRNSYFLTDATVPEMSWKKTKVVLADSTVYDIEITENNKNVNKKSEYVTLSRVSNFRIEKHSHEVLLFWNWQSNNSCNKQVYFEIYQFQKGELLIPDKEHLIATTVENEIAMPIKRHLFKRKYTYVVKVHCGHFQSPESEALHIRY